MQYNIPAYGISLTNTTNVIVTNNTITGFESIEAWNVGSYFGIGVESGASNTIAGNNLTYNLKGIFLSNTADNKVVGNNIVGDVTFNSLYTTGIYLADASNNTFYQNNITNSTKQADVPGSVNIWDDGYHNGGNYWGDYLTKYPNAYQIDSSGIGNTPYVIDKNNIGHYPLIHQVDISTISTTLTSYSNPTPTPTQISSPTPTVPEFPTWIILPLFAAIMLLSTVFIRKIIPKTGKTTNQEILRQETLQKSFLSA